MSGDPFHAIVVAAADLKLAAPDRYTKLIEALAVLEENCTTALRAAPNDVIFLAQGKAQLMHQLRLKMEHCINLKAAHEQKTIHERR